MREKYPQVTNPVQTIHSFATIRERDKLERYLYFVAHTHTGCSAIGVGLDELAELYARKGPV